MVVGFRLVLSILFFFSLPVLAGEFILKNASCGGSVSGLILPGDAGGLVAGNELSFRQGLVAAAKQQVDDEYHAYARVHGWLEAFHEGRSVVLELPGKTAEDAKEAGHRAMEKAIEANLSLLRGDERALKSLKYFGVHYPGVSAQRLQKLGRALLIQCYLARFEALTLERLAVWAPIDTPLFSASPDIVDVVNIEVTDEMKDPKRIEDRFLSILPRIPLRTYGVITDEKGAVESAYLRADNLLLDAAKAKAEAFALDAGVPDVVRDFSKWYLLGVSIRPQGRVHPLLADWASNVEGFLTPEPQK